MRHRTLRPKILSAAHTRNAHAIEQIIAGYRNNLTSVPVLVVWSFLFSDILFSIKAPFIT